MPHVRPIKLLQMLRISNSNFSQGPNGGRGRVQNGGGTSDRTQSVKYLDSEESQAWLRQRLASSGIGTLTRLAEVTGINKGTLSKYFRQIQRPTVDVVAILCGAFKVSAAEVLYGLGALEGDSETITPDSKRS